MDSSAPNMDLLSWTFGNAAVDEEQGIFVDAEDAQRRYSKGQLRTLVRQLVAGFKRLAAAASRPEFVVCVHSFNHISYAALFLGIVGAGGTWAGSNPAYTVGELVHQLQLSKADFIVAGPERLDHIVAAARECNIPSENIFVLNGRGEHVSDGLQSWNDLLQHGEADWITFDDESRAKKTTVALFSTSGTTGLPKMAARTHHSFVAESFALRDVEPKPYKPTRLLSVPFFHAFASQIALVSALRDGCLTYVMRRFTRQLYLDTLHEHQITETAVVPPLLLDFLSYTPAQQAKLSSLKLAFCGGAPLDPFIQAKACQLFAPAARIVQVWGMSECGWISTFRHPERDETGSVGRLIPGYTMKLIDDHGHVLTGDGRPGEICVKGPTLMLGYLGNDKATRETIDDQGWLRTGDVATVRKGKIYIVDRKKELIKIRGWQLAPAEVEGTLLMHPAIADAAVIGVPGSDCSSEIPRAYVVRARNCSVDESDIRTFLLKHLARYKVSDCEIRFRDSIPKSASGKILRKVLRAECACEEEGEFADCFAPATESSPVRMAGGDYGSGSCSPDLMLIWQCLSLLSALWRWLRGPRLRYLAALGLHMPIRRWVHQLGASV